nr:lipocalin-like domain-containing protein [Mesobaculum littorinae]
MSVDRRLVLTGLLTLPVTARAQGFAGLGTGARGYAMPRPGPFDFPADHGPHPEFRIEWWYVTANLRDAAGRDCGVQWTLFRSALAPPGAGPEGPWAAQQAWMGHAAVTTPEVHLSAERLARGGTGQAGASVQPFGAWIDDWRLTGPTPDRVEMVARGDAFSYALTLAADGPVVPQGEGGYSVKSAAGQASRYYSQPFYRAEGQLRLGDAAVQQVSGTAWLDREWSSQPLAEDQSGWDWFSLNFDSGEKLMAFRLRGEGAPFVSATWIAADGTPTPYGGTALRIAPLREAAVAGRQVPVAWSLALPEKGVDIRVEAVNDAAWMTTAVAYWEGPMRISGSHGGRGYLEMTGYD